MITDDIDSHFQTINAKECKNDFASNNAFEPRFVPSSRDAIYELLIRLPQKKVVIPAYTCMVVNEAVLLSGKEILFSKTRKEDFNSSYIECIDKDCIVLATH